MAKRSCKFGKVKSGPRKGACRKTRKPRKSSKLGGMFSKALPGFKKSKKRRK
jgi:hypothetical protein